jgi:hypothetical protein
MERITLLVAAQLTDTLRHPSKAIATATPTSQPDLLFMRSLLVSAGWNGNDDVFLPEELWPARHTPAYKPVNWEHSSGRELSPDEQARAPGQVVVDNQTIGVMYDTYTIDGDGVPIQDDSTPPHFFHIVDEAVIWRGLYPNTAARISKAAQDNSLFVSMEVWFKNYDYLVGDRIVARNTATAFLDNHLRALGGNGVYENSRVRRVLRGLTFGGKGIVARPANEPSIIMNVSQEPISATAAQDDKILQHTVGNLGYLTVASKGINMTVEKPVEKSELTAVQAQLAATEKTVAELTAKLADASKASETLKIVLAKGFQQLETTLPGLGAKVSKDNPENFFTVLASFIEEDKKAAVELQGKFKAALEKVAAMEEQARHAVRASKIDAALATLKLSDEQKKSKRDALLTSTKSLDDASFDSVLATLVDVSKSNFMEKEDEKKKEEKKEEKKEDAGEKLKQLATLLGVDEKVAASVKDALAPKTHTEDLSAVLNHVKASEKVPAGNEVKFSGDDIVKAYAPLVEQMLSKKK